MRKLILAAVVLTMSMVAALPIGVARAGGNSAAAKTCQTDYAALGFANRGACTSFYARGGGLEPPPPTGAPALNVVGDVYNSCIAAGTTCWLGVYGTGLLPGSVVTLNDVGVCCEMTFPVPSSGTVTLEGIFVCGGTGTRSFTFVVAGVGDDGTAITAAPLSLPGLPC